MGRMLDLPSVIELAPRSWTIGRDIFFSAEDYTNMSYYNCCGIRPYCILWIIRDSATILRPLMTILFNINYTNMVSKGATHIISFNILFQNERPTLFLCS
jgi:ABC-type dipeptide/oligopeptide/nickel transport system ATPase component